MRRSLACLAAVLLIALAACGDDGGGSSADPTVPDTSSTTASTAPDTATEPEAPEPPDDEELPGEAIEIYPYEGADLMVVGVEADDTLNVRAGPGTDFDVVATLEPLADGVVATGHNRTLDDDGLWAEVTVEGTTGWANGAFLAHRGETRDATTEIVTDPADPPGAETMLDLGHDVAELLAPGGEGPPTRVTVVAGPTIGDLGEITLDVLGLGDDAALGWRVHVFANPAPGGEAFVLRTVETTVLCSRGSDGTLCL